MPESIFGRILLLQSCHSIWLSWTLWQFNTIEDSHTADAIALHIGTSWRAWIINKEITLRIEEIFRWNFWLLHRSHLVMLHKPLCVLVGRLSLSEDTDKDKLITLLKKNIGLDLNIRTRLKIKIMNIEKCWITCCAGPLSPCRSSAASACTLGLLFEFLLIIHWLIDFIDIFVLPFSCCLYAWICVLY